jgi:hypothetical protein
MPDQEPMPCCRKLSSTRKPKSNVDEIARSSNFAKRLGLRRFTAAFAPGQSSTPRNVHWPDRVHCSNGPRTWVELSILLSPAALSPFQPWLCRNCTIRESKMCAETVQKWCRNDAIQGTYVWNTEHRSAWLRQEAVERRASLSLASTELHHAQIENVCRNSAETVQKRCNSGNLRMERRLARHGISRPQTLDPRP